jgi:GET complex subunit GET2
VPIQPTSGTATPESKSPAKPQEVADPAEVDISEHYYPPKTTPRVPATPPVDPSSITEDQLRQMMLGFDRAGGPVTPPQGFNPFGMPTNQEGAGGMEEQLMQMMSQFMSGNPPPGGAPGMMPHQPQAPPPPLDTYAYLWRILHAVFAIGLGLYIAMGTGYSGSKIQRQRIEMAQLSPSSTAEGENNQAFFWMFATAEAMLLTTRYFLDRGRAPPSGMLWNIAGFLPGPFKGYVETALRYGQIVMTVRSDLLLCVFILGACSWWRVASYTP